MADKISIDLTDQEQLLLYAQELVAAAQETQVSISAAIQTFQEISASGSFKDIYVGVDGGGASSDGFSRYVLKAQDLVTLSEVLYTHIENTYSAMIDTDKLIAMQIVNEVYLNNSEVDQTTKDYIKENPAEAIDFVKTHYGLNSEG